MPLVEEFCLRMTFDLGLLPALFSGTPLARSLSLSLPRMEWAGRLLRTALVVVVRDHVSKRSQWARPKKKKDMCDVATTMPNHVGGGGGGGGRAVQKTSGRGSWH